MLHEDCHGLVRGHQEKERSVGGWGVIHREKHNFYLKIYVVVLDVQV